MMKQIFDKIVLSQTEPSVEDLWMKLTFDKGQPLGHSLWWFSPQGWKKLFDFDTRYNTSWSFENVPQTGKPLEVEEVYNPKIGIVKVDNTLHIYDAKRAIGNNNNLVNETGLKWHVDDLQKKINNLQEQITELKTSNATLSQRVSSLTTSYESLLSRVAALEQQSV